MTALYQTPGVYIVELAGPGVIEGVGTSTPVFLGPAAAGPINEPVFITTFDDFGRNFGIPQVTGAPLLYIPTSSVAKRRYYLTDAVRGFFLNGGTEAYVVRVSNAQQATWSVVNQATNPEIAFLVQAVAQGTSGNGMKVVVAASSLVSAVPLASGTAKVANIDSTKTVITVDSAAAFLAGDTLTVDQTQLAVVASIDPTNTIITLQAPLTGLAVGNTLTIADITPTTSTVRLKNPGDSSKLYPGSVLLIQGNIPAGTAGTDYAVVESVTRLTGVLLLTNSPLRTNTFRPGTTPTTLTSQEFTLTVTPPGGGANVVAANLSLESNHPNYVLGTAPTNPVAVLSGTAVIAQPPVPTISNYPAKLVKPQSFTTPSIPGSADNPDALGYEDYSNVLDLLLDFEDINMVCIPDAASHPTDWLQIQNEMVDYCTNQSTSDRMALLDSRPGLPPGPGTPSVVNQVQSVNQAGNGFATLYYPWLTVPDMSLPPNVPSTTVNVPPCGHMAGIWAKVAANPGVWQSPANVTVSGVVGLEQVLSDRKQGPLNLSGVNVMRIFPGSGAVTVWGARTTVNTASQGITWQYISTRRLLLYIELSIKQALRPFVFQPNNESLWGALTREIEEFLTVLWSAGALFGDTAAQAFYVRIDAGNNPPNLMAQGQLNIEIGVVPSYPAEFIIVSIGIWDGGTQVTES